MIVRRDRKREIRWNKQNKEREKYAETNKERDIRWNTCQSLPRMHVCSNKQACKELAKTS
jgi:hypothetical protein